MASLVTIVGKTLQYVLATDYPSFQYAEQPREHTLCQHLLMGTDPCSSSIQKPTSASAI